MHHQNKDQKEAIVDATYVLENLDSKNPKALLRRSHAYKSFNKWGEAVKDLQELNKVTKEDDPKIKKDLNFCLAKFMESQKKKAPAQTQQKPAAKQASSPLIEEVQSKPSDFKKVNIVEDDSSDDSDDQAEA